MLFAPSRPSLVALVAMAAVGACAECLPSDYYIPANESAGVVEQCCPRFPVQARNIPCGLGVVDGFHTQTCSFAPQGNEPYVFKVPESSARTQDLYIELRGAPGESTRRHRGGKGASIEGTLKAKQGLLYVYVGAGGGGADDHSTQTGRGVLWGAGGGYSSIGEGLPNGQDVSGGHCFRHASSAKHGDCRLLVAAGGGGAGPKSDGEPAGMSRLGMTHNMYGAGSVFGNSGGSGGGYLGGKVWNGHGGGGGAIRVGSGSFTTLYRAASPSTEAFVSIRASCYPPISLPVVNEASPPPRAIVNQAEAETQTAAFDHAGSGKGRGGVVGGKKRPHLI